MLCRNEVLLAVILTEAHHVPADLGFLRYHVFRNYMAIEHCIAANKRFSTQIGCKVRGTWQVSFKAQRDPVVDSSSPKWRQWWTDLN